MKKLLVFLFTICLLLIPLMVNAQQYLCECEKSTGFKYNKVSKEWEAVNFDVAGQKYILSKKDDKTGAYKLVTLGADYDQGTSNEGFNELGIIFIDTIGGKFIFNKNNGRYIESYLAAYYVEGLASGDNKLTDEDDATPAIEIGVCSPF